MSGEHPYLRAHSGSLMCLPLPASRLADCSPVFSLREPYVDFDDFGLLR